MQQQVDSDFVAVWSGFVIKIVVILPQITQVKNLKFYWESHCCLRQQRLLYNQKWAWPLNKADWLFAFYAQVEGLYIYGLWYNHTLHTEFLLANN